MCTSILWHFHIHWVATPHIQAYLRRSFSAKEPSLGNPLIYGLFADKVLKDQIFFADRDLCRQRSEREALQHTATHSNTHLLSIHPLPSSQQHKVLHCNTLQHTATHCNTLLCEGLGHPVALCTSANCSMYWTGNACHHMSNVCCYMHACHPMSKACHVTSMTWAMHVTWGSRHRRDVHHMSNALTCITSKCIDVHDLRNAPTSTAYCIWSVIQSQFPLAISLVSFQRNVVK